MKKRHFIFALLTVLVLVLSFFFLKGTREYFAHKGSIFGTYYSIKYQAKKSYLKSLKMLFEELDYSLSTYKTNSIISRVNNNDTGVIPDKYFIEVFKKAKEISKKTDGAFDMTVSPVVDAWGFGAGKKLEMDSLLIDSLLQFVGMEKIDLVNKKVIKKFPQTQLDGSAIAKGYAVDVLANFLEEKNIENYLIEIGGEIRAKGLNFKSKSWSVGINKPQDDTTAQNKELHEVIKLKNGALATSGNYRQFYYKEGKKYAHTIDPHTGYPVQHKLLSASVFANDCITADAYATAFMVVGVEKSLQLAEQIEKVEVYLIYEDKNNKMRTAMSNGFSQLIYE